VTRFPYYIFLLPVFFVFHNSVYHRLAIDIKTQLLISGYYCIAAGLLLLISFLLLKDIKKAGLITLCILAINFFFPEVHLFLRTYPLAFFNRYVFIIPFLAALIIFVFIKLRKINSSLKKVTVYLNVLLLVFVLAECVTLLVNTIRRPESKVKIADKVHFTPCDTCAKPDIYLLLFDEYSSSLSLHNDYNYDNRFLDTFLIKKGFKILPESKSNYNITNFSMASIINMSYLGISKPEAVTSIDYSDAADLIQSGYLFTCMKQMGYKIENYSIFNIGDEKAPLRYLFTETPEEMVTNKTFVNTFLRDAGWNFANKKNLYLPLKKKYAEGFDNIQQAITKVKAAAISKSAHPRFIYGHFLLPHPPFFMNKTQPYTTEKLAETHSSSVSAYLNYVFYTNIVLRDLVDFIQTSTNGKSAIIIMGDHGFRPPVQTAFPEKYFANQNAVYFPEKNYSLLYDSISAVNEFRAILNTLYRQNIPLLQDKQYYLTDRK